MASSQPHIIIEIREGKVYRAWASHARARVSVIHRDMIPIVCDGIDQAKEQRKLVRTTRKLYPINEDYGD